VIRFLPFSRETLVSNHSAEELYRKLWQVTKPVRSEKWMPDVPEQDFKFNGWVKGDRFRLSRKIKRANNFLPIMSGRIETTSMGSIIFINYQLFFSTTVFLVFWSAITLLFSLYFFVYEQIYINAAASLLLGIVNYVVAVMNFKKEVRISSRYIQEVIA
jgi:hypothetical protein